MASQPAIKSIMPAPPGMTYFDNYGGFFPVVGLALVTHHPDGAPDENVVEPLYLKNGTVLAGRTHYDVEVCGEILDEQATHARQVEQMRRNAGKTVDYLANLRRPA